MSWFLKSKSKKTRFLDYNSPYASYLAVEMGYKISRSKGRFKSWLAKNSQDYPLWTHLRGNWGPSKSN